MFDEFGEAFETRLLLSLFILHVVEPCIRRDGEEKHEEAMTDQLHISTRP